MERTILLLPVGYIAAQAQGTQNSRMYFTVVYKKLQVMQCIQQTDKADYISFFIPPNPQKSL